MWAGSRKFATPSFTAYSCPQHPHTNLPSCMHVSRSTRWRSFAVWLGVCSVAAPVAGAESVVSSAELEESMRSAGVGAVSGRAGRPNCEKTSATVLYPSSPKSLRLLFSFALAVRPPSRWGAELRNPLILRTSPQIVLNSGHIRRGSMFVRNGRLMSASRISSSASRGCSGKDATFVLHVLTEQVRKLRVRSFILGRRRCELSCDLPIAFEF
jgi:hypothetical protein